MPKEIEIEIKHPEFLALIVVLIIVFGLQLEVSLTSPIVFGDSGYHVRLGQWISEHKEYPVWNPVERTKIFATSYDKPPAWHFLEGSIFALFGFHESLIKFLTPFITFLTGLLIYFLSKELFNRRVAFIAAFLTVTIPSMVTYAVLFYDITLFLLYLTFSCLTLILAVEKKSKKYWLLSIVFASLAFLTKREGVVIFFIYGLTFLYELYKKRNFEVVKKYLVLTAIFLVIAGPWLARNYELYGTPLCGLPKNPFFNEKCKVTFSYQPKTTEDFVGRTTPTGTELSLFKFGITNYLNFAYGIIWLVPLLFICGIFIFLKEKSQKNILLLLMLIAWIPIFYVSTGRAECTIRYTLGVVPVISLIASSYLNEVCEFVRKYQKYLGLIIIVGVILIGLFLNLIPKLKVMKAVKSFSPTFFEACDWVKEHPEKVPENATLATVWDHRTIYNCQRNAIGYANLPDSRDIILSNNLTLVLGRLKEEGITHLFIQKFSIDQKPYREKYPVSFVQFLEQNPKAFIKIYENGPSLQDCLNRGYCDGNIIYEINYTAV